MCNSVPEGVAEDLPAPAGGAFSGAGGEGRKQQGWRQGDFPPFTPFPEARSP